MKALYKVGKGVIIEFSPDDTELCMALETIRMVRDVTGTSNLDQIILAITNTLTPPPAVMHICEQCWRPIDPRVHETVRVNGRILHATCPT